MSKESERLRVKRAMEKSGSDWLFGYWGDDLDKNLDKVAKDLAQFTREYKRRFHDTADPFALLEVNHLKGAAFFQPDTLIISVEMKVMVWRLLMGCEIARVEFHYAAGEEPMFKAVLRPLSGEGEETYVGERGMDYRVLRHFGATGKDEELVLFGYYAYRATSEK